MRKPRPLGLIASGQVAKPYLALLHSLAGRLGPVKALSPRVASRIVNRLGAGYPAARYQDLDPARLIILCVEDPRLLLQIAAEMAATEAAWSHRPVVVCHPAIESAEFGALAARGARIASLWLPEESHVAGYLAEGDRQAIREFRRALPAPGPRIRVLRKGTKPLYLAGLDFSSGLVTPLAAAAVECFRAAGLNPPSSFAALEQAVLRALRAYRKAGKKGWSSPLDSGAGHAGFNHRLQALENHDPALAGFYRATALLAHQRLATRGKSLAASPETR